jgi:hypothetical protein
MATPQEPAAHCPHCGAEVQTPGGPCWLCRQKASQAGPNPYTINPDATNPYATPRPIGDNVAQFSLASLFLVMTLVAVCLGVIMIAPGLGILFAFITTPAFIRTMVAASRGRQIGAPLSPLEKTGIFLISWFIMCAVGIASVVAFMAVCVAGALITEGAGARLEIILTVGVLGGLAAAIPLTVWLLRLTSPSRMEFGPSPGRR